MKEDGMWKKIYTMMDRYSAYKATMFCFEPISREVDIWWKRPDGHVFYYSFFVHQIH